MLLIGAAGILIPIVIHLLNRRTDRVIDWGAMNFLFQSLVIRNRRIQLEEALLMASRCLLVGLLALALARPFVPPGSGVPWLLVLPLLLLGVVGLGVATVLHNARKWRFWIGLLSVLALAACAAMIVFEKELNLSRFGGGGGRQDVALIIDASTSMSLEIGGVSNFERAVEEARELVKRAPRGHAFSLILGGPAPSAKILDPTTDRAELESVLDDLQPLDGPMATYHALTLASLGLARGDNPAKQIVVFTDAQNVGWESGKTARWNFLRDAFKNLSTEPQIVLRRMPLPENLRNLAVTGVEFSRDIVGIDRSVEIAVTVENTGNEAVTPDGLELQVAGGPKLAGPALGQIAPGATETATFTHQFTTPGAQSVRCRLEVEDEIPQDNMADAALNVADSLKVLIVDGRPGGRFFERAGTFAALALAPSALTLNPSLKANQTVSGDEEDDGAASYDPALDPVRFLVEPALMPVSDVATMPDFEAFDAVLLADVPRLPADSARKLVNYVRAGGGLLVAPGEKAVPAFYNGWLDAEGAPFLPAKLSETMRLAGEGDAVSPSVRSLTGPVLAKVGGKGRGDLANAVFRHWWGLEVPDALSGETAIGARLNTGDPLLASRVFGAGKVMLLAAPLDNSTSNLATRQSFLPFAHELVYHLANPAAYDLNLEPGYDLSLLLSTGRRAAIGTGLKAEYFADHGAKTPVVSRVDPNVQFNWLMGAPAEGVGVDNFRVEWTGKIQPLVTDTFTFEAEVDDELEVWIDGKSVLKATYERSSRGRGVKLESNRWHDIRVRYLERGADARAILYWEGKKTPRQIVPPDRLRSFAGPADGKAVEGSVGGALASYSVTGPDGGARRAELGSTERGTLFKILGDVSSGLYRLRIPEAHRSYFRAFLPEGRDAIPFTVKRDPGESRLTRLNEADRAFLSQFVTLVEPGTLDDVLGILTGNQFGRELWKYLVLGAFFFLLAEIALSRWIAVSRRTGEEIKIDFESKEAPTAGFKAQLDRMRGVAAEAPAK
ncbi:MAG: VWA domain-containing protein [Akkermansiaceae bacterium]|nr:VWA domain-containing protein [Akkermansiaceae bacterium]